MLLDIVQAIAGLVLLVFAGDVLVRGAVGMAEQLGVPALVIGLTVVAFGTSAPELVVGVDAVLYGAPTLALGNVVGSNIANILLVVGLPALIAPMACTASKITRNLLMMLGASIIFIIMALLGPIAWPKGIILLGLLIAFLFYNLKKGREEPELADQLLDPAEAEAAKKLSTLMIAALVIGGLIGLIVGANFLVEGSVAIARAVGVSEAVIGLTLVAVGTSLPELVTATVAAVRNQADVAVGNVIGSNIFNLLAIIGVSSLVGPIPVPPEFLRVDLWVMLASSAVLLPFCLARASIGRLSGGLLLAGYAGYLAWLV